MKDLPKVFANKIDESINNDQELFYGSVRGEDAKDDISVVKKINNIFADSHHVYKSRVRITLKNGVVEKVIVGKTSSELITIDGELIKIVDIVDIVKL